MKVEKPDAKPTNPPTLKFREWWMPTGHNARSGAQTGGHPDALRKCVNNDGKVAYFGIRVEESWACQHYQDEFHQWLKDGQPERFPEVDGTAAPLDRQKEIIRQCMKTIGL